MDQKGGKYILKKYILINENNENHISTVPLFNQSYTKNSYDALGNGP